MEPCSAATFRTPSRFQRKSRCHQLRRYSPSVTARRPRAFCLATSWAISASSTWRSCRSGYPPLRKALPCLFEGIAPEEAADDIRRTGKGQPFFGMQRKGNQSFVESPLSGNLVLRVRVFLAEDPHGLYHVAKRKQRFRPSPGFSSPQSGFTQSFSGAINRKACSRRSNISSRPGTRGLWIS